MEPDADEERKKLNKIQRDCRARMKTERPEEYEEMKAKQQIVAVLAIDGPAAESINISIAVAHRGET